MAIGRNILADVSFLEPLTESLAKLDAVTSEEVLPITTKARSDVPETRDTVHPRFITEMLTGFQRAIGEPLNIARIYKHTRDDVLWRDVFRPWRRSPLWLFLRVALQTTLVGKKDEEEPHVRYKSFMLFFMTHISQLALQASLPSDVLFMMKAKIGRRALKLGAVDQTSWLHHTKTIIGTVQQELACRWNLLETNPDPQGTQQNWFPSQLSFLPDTMLTLSNLRPYLAKVAQRATSPSTCQRFIPGCFRRALKSSSNLPDLSFFIRMNKDELRLHLADLELWVQESLNDWLRINLDRKEACGSLTDVIYAYTSAAFSAYAGEPEDMSLMLLTSIELWVALDKCAAHLYPLLRDYDPEFRSSLFESLLLPKKTQMERLLHVEQYLAERRAAILPGSPSIFRSNHTAGSFAVRYFDQSPPHQELRRIIVADANNERIRRKSELAQKRQRYRELMQQSDEMSCQYVSRRQRRQQSEEHSGNCQKCKLKSQAKALSIDVHEWPLPENDFEVKAVVIELDMPMVISKWRDATHSILVDLFSVDTGAPTPPDRGVYNLHSYAGLKKYVESQTGRLQFASITKPFVISHYRDQRVFQTDEDRICVNNGLSYTLYNWQKQEWKNDIRES